MRSSANAEELRDTAAFLSANHAFRPSLSRSTSVSSIASSSAVAAALRAGSRTPEHGDVVAAAGRNSSTMSDRRQESLTAPSLPARPPQSRSPSHAAALVAAARAATLKSEESTPTRPSSTRPRPSPDARSERVASGSLDTSNDTSSIPSTTSLVSLFEQKSSSRKAAPAPIAIRPASSVPIQSPKPLRPDGISSVFQMEVGPPGRLQSSQAVQDGRRQESVGVLGAPQESGPGNIQQRPSALQGRRSSDRGQGGNGYKDNNDSDISRRQQGTQAGTLGDGTEIHDFARSNRDQDGRSQERAVGTSPQSIDSKPPRPASRRSTQDGRSATRDIPPRLPARTQTNPTDLRPRTRPISSYETITSSNQSVPATYRQLYPKKTTPLTKDDELANAIVASSLASTRSTTRRDIPPPPVTRRQSRSHHFFHSRTPSPVKQGLLQTLRKQDSSESEEAETHPYGRHHKKRLIRKHPNKHHEGDRKRWRDAVTESERKRYEGVWAANKGLYIVPMPSDSDKRLDTEAPGDQVCNIVVKDIWSRSRLPDYELEAVWDLVDTEANGRLSKEEFVVGMWLIDQRLKGRKLPVKVQPTVWTSVRGLQGIKIRKQQ